MRKFTLLEESKNNEIIHPLIKDCEKSIQNLISDIKEEYDINISTQLKDFLIDTISSNINSDIKYLKLGIDTDDISDILLDISDISEHKSSSSNIREGIIRYKFVVAFDSNLAEFISTINNRLAQLGLYYGIFFDNTKYVICSDNLNANIFKQIKVNIDKIDMLLTDSLKGEFVNIVIVIMNDFFIKNRTMVHLDPDHHLRRMPYF